MLLRTGVVADPSTSSAQLSSANGSAKAPSAQVTAPRETARESVSPTTATSTATAPRDIGSRLDMRTISACHDALLEKKALEYHVNCDDIPVEQTSLVFAAVTRPRRRNGEQATSSGLCPRISSASAYYEAIKNSPCGVSGAAASSGILRERGAGRRRVADAERSGGRISWLGSEVHQRAFGAATGAWCAGWLEVE
jgi:hypothetical protein